MIELKQSDHVRNDSGLTMIDSKPPTEPDVRSGEKTYGGGERNYVEQLEIKEYSFSGHDPQHQE